jgi:hypothetical protein
VRHVTVACASRVSLAQVSMLRQCSGNQTVKVKIGMSALEFGM